MKKILRDLDSHEHSSSTETNVSELPNHSNLEIPSVEMCIDPKPTSCSSMPPTSEIPTAQSVENLSTNIPTVMPKTNSEVRRSTRVKFKPSRHKDYVMPEQVSMSLISF